MKLSKLHLYIRMLVHLMHNNNFVGTHDVQNILLINETDLNAIHIAVTFINNSRAIGALVVLIPDSHAGNTQTVDELQSTFSFVIPNPSGTTTFTSVHDEVPLGAYEVLVYDIEENGLLNVPSAMPAIISTVTTHGCATLVDSWTNKPMQVNIAADIYKTFLIINCTHVNEDKIQGCLVVLSSRFSPEQLHVHIQLRDSPFPLVYTVKPETRYTITAFAIKENSGILNSTINSMEVYVGMFLYHYHGIHSPKQVMKTSLVHGLLFYETLYAYRI